MNQQAAVLAESSAIGVICLKLLVKRYLVPVISRSIDHRSISDARLSDEQLAQRQKLRDQEPNEIGVPQ